LDPIVESLREPRQLALAVVVIIRPPDERLADDPSVFEQLADGTSVPIPNAQVWIGGEMTPLHATTFTDPDGRYLVCGIPRGSNEFAVTATGYRQTPGREVDVSADMTLDFQMKR